MILFISLKSACFLMVMSSLTVASFSGYAGVFTHYWCYLLLSFYYVLVSLENSWFAFLLHLLGGSHCPRSRTGNAGVFSHYCSYSPRRYLLSFYYVLVSAILLMVFTSWVVSTFSVRLSLPWGSHRLRFKNI